jgi:hypothetical protein
MENFGRKSRRKRVKIDFPPDLRHSRQHLRLRIRALHPGTFRAAENGRAMPVRSRQPYRREGAVWNNSWQGEIADVNLGENWRLI